MANSIAICTAAAAIFVAGKAAEAAASFDAKHFWQIGFFALCSVGDSRFDGQSRKKMPSPLSVLLHTLPGCQRFFCFLRQTRGRADDFFLLHKLILRRFSLFPVHIFCFAQRQEI